MSKNQDDRSAAMAQDKPATGFRFPPERELVKYGLAAGLGLLVVTGFSRNRLARGAHVLAGTAVVGLSVWHHMLYAPKGKAGKRAAREKSSS